MMARTGTVTRKTTETNIVLSLLIDGTGSYKIATAIGFFDHMLELMAKHGLMDLSCTCSGDLHIDGHHTVEDVGICLGQAISQALVNKQSIKRYGTAFIPMDEALVMVSIDISGRPFLSFDTSFTNSMVGNFDTQLVEEFFRALSIHAGITVHIHTLYGNNTHHIIEAMFKAFGKAFHDASSTDSKVQGLPTTKGLL